MGAEPLSAPGAAVALWGQATRRLRGVLDPVLVLQDGLDVRVGDHHVVQLQLRGLRLRLHGPDEVHDGSGGDTGGFGDVLVPPLHPHWGSSNPNATMGDAFPALSATLGICTIPSAPGAKGRGHGEKDMGTRTWGRGHEEKDMGTRTWGQGQGHGDTLVPPLHPQWCSQRLFPTSVPSCMTLSPTSGVLTTHWRCTKGHGDKDMGTRTQGSHGVPELTWCHRGAGGPWGGSSAACTPPPGPRRTPGRWWPRPRWPR